MHTEISAAKNQDRMLLVPAAIVEVTQIARLKWLTPISAPMKRKLMDKPAEWNARWMDEWGMG